MPEKIFNSGCHDYREAERFGWSFNSGDQTSSETRDAKGGKTSSYNSQNQFVGMNVIVVQTAHRTSGEHMAKSVNHIVMRYRVEDDVNPTGILQVFDVLNGTGPVMPGCLTHMPAHFRLLQADHLHIIH